MHSISLFLLFICISATLACKCVSQSGEKAFCNAHWVSHIKVKIRTSKQAVPNSTTRRGLNNLRYSVEHIKVFKKPSNLTTLPNEIYTPSESPACGLIIDSGKEYLLAGRVESGNLYTVLCGQVLPDESTRTSFENVLEWQNVPKTLQDQIAAYKC